jgi:ketosteroid isomerase-like protein
MSEENLEIVRRSYEAFNSRDLTLIGNVLHPDFELNLSSSMGLDRGNYVGEGGLRRFFESYWDAFESISIEVEELIGSGDAIVAIIRVRARGTGSGVEVDARGPHLWSFRDGKVVGLAFYEHLDEALEAAGAAQAGDVEGAKRSDPTGASDRS